MKKKVFSPFGYHTFRYHLLAPHEVAVAKLDELLLWKSSASPLMSKIKGTFIDYPFTFILTSNNRYSGFGQADASLQGKIEVIGKNETSIEIKVRPGLIYSLFFVAFFLFGVWALVKGIIEQELYPVSTGIFFLLIVLPLISFFAQRATNQLKQIVERQFNVHL